MANSVEHVVIGGGPAGSMLALRLATAGCDVTLLEKEREPHHKVCGEFLSQEAIGSLQRVGIDPQELGAQSIDRVRLHSRYHTAESRIPFAALSLSRHALDKALLELAAAAGSNVRTGAFAENLHPDTDRWIVRLRGGQSIKAKTVFLATGKHDVNDWPRSRGSQSDLVGFKMHWKLDRAEVGALRNSMELFLFRDGYGGLSLVENDTANLCFVARRGRLRELGGWTELLSAIRREAPRMDERLHSGIACWTRPLAISPIPYGHLGGPSNGLWRVGDQAAVIPSFTGDGMSIALHSAELAAKMYLQNRSPDEYLRCLANQLGPQMRLATALSQAIITPTGRMMAPLVLAIAPGAMRWIAKKTRIPNDVLPQLQTESDERVRPSSASIA